MSDDGTGREQSPIILSSGRSLRAEFPKDYLVLEALNTPVSVQLDGGHEHPFFKVRAHERSPPSVMLHGQEAWLDGVHVHKGSEHDLDGVQHGGELHLVYRIGRPYLHESALIVLGAVFDLVRADEGEDEKCPSGEVKLKLADLGLDFQKFYRYEGSLTTGEGSIYREVVSWVVSATVHQFKPSPTRTALLRCATQTERPTQPIGRRFVLRNF